MLIHLSFENKPNSLSHTHGVRVVVLTRGPHFLMIFLVPPFSHPLLFLERSGRVPFASMSHPDQTSQLKSHVIELHHPLNLIVGRAPITPSHFSVILALDSLSLSLKVTLLKQTFGYQRGRVGEG